MHDRVLRYPERVKNLYFTFLFVLRSVTKVSVLALRCIYRSCLNYRSLLSMFDGHIRQQITWSKLIMILVILWRMLIRNFWWRSCFMITNYKRLVLNRLMRLNYGKVKVDQNWCSRLKDSSEILGFYLFFHLLVYYHVLFVKSWHICHACQCQHCSLICIQYKIRLDTGAVLCWGVKEIAQLHSIILFFFCLGFISFFF